MRGHCEFCAVGPERSVVERSAVESVYEEDPAAMLVDYRHVEVASVFRCH
jgi:hypothetical protein